MATELSDGAMALSNTATQGGSITSGGVGGAGGHQDLVTPLEQDLLDEYERLADNMKKLAGLLDTMAGAPTAEILHGLEQLERKTSLVFTLLKASVYSIVLQQEIYSGDQTAGQET